MARKERLPITRKGAGRGFYFELDSQRITDPQEIARLKALAIPPAWSKVRIARTPRAKVQAIGIDAAGRTQSIYNPAFRARQDEAKFGRMLDFGLALPYLRSQVLKDLRRRTPTEQKVSAAVIALIDQHLLRIGDPAGARSGASFGATTLRRKHLKSDGGAFRLEFTGKSGQPQAIRVTDRKLANILGELRDLPGHELFRFLDDDNRSHRLDAQRVNRYLHEHLGGEFTAKDFRTWGGTVCALRAALQAERATAAEPQKLVRAAIDEAAAKLGNTLTIARDSYIDPRVLQLCEDPERLTKLRRSYRQMPARNHLDPAERCLVKLLQPAAPH